MLATLMLVIAWAATIDGWSFSLSQASGTVSITEGGSTPMSNFITQMFLLTNPPGGSAINDAYACRFGTVSGYMSYPASVYQKFALLPGAFQYLQYGTYCTLSQVAPINCSTDLAGSSYLVVKLQMVDLSLATPASAISDIVDYKVLITCSTATTTTTTTTTNTPITTTTAFVNSPGGIAVIVIAALVFLGLIGVITAAIVTKCFKASPSLVVESPPEPVTSPKPESPAFQDYKTSRTYVEPTKRSIVNANSGSANGGAGTGTPSPQFRNSVPLTRVNV